MEPPLSVMVEGAADPDEPYKRQDSRRKPQKRSLRRKRRTWRHHRPLSKFCSSPSRSTPLKRDSSSWKAKFCSAFFLQQEARYKSWKSLKDSVMDLTTARLAPHSKFVLSRRCATAS